MRLILTFTNLHQVLSAEKVLRASGDTLLSCRPTPTPPGLSQAICGMAVELLDCNGGDKALDYLKKHNLEPSGVFLLED